MKCLDDCHTYGMDTVMGTYHPPIHFYEMREDGIKIDGVTNEEVLKVLVHRLTKLNKKNPCPENNLAIDDLKSALTFLNLRTRDRVGRKVEGTHKP